MPTYFTSLVTPQVVKTKTPVLLVTTNLAVGMLLIFLCSLNKPSHQSGRWYRVSGDTGRCPPWVHWFSGSPHYVGNIGRRCCWSQSPGSQGSPGRPNHIRRSSSGRVVRDRQTSVCFAGFGSYPHRLQSGNVSISPSRNELSGFVGQGGIIVKYQCSIVYQLRTLFCGYLCIFLIRVRVHTLFLPLHKVFYLIHLSCFLYSSLAIGQSRDCPGASEVTSTYAICISHELRPCSNFNTRGRR